MACFTLAALAWGVMRDDWARECASGVLVVAESEECMNGLRVRLGTLAFWFISVAHAAMGRSSPLNY